MKVSFIVYADRESLLEKMSTCHNNLEKSSITKINKRKPSGDSLFTHFSFDLTKNKLDYYKGKGCMERFCKDLEEHATKIINYEKKETVRLTDEENKSYKKRKVYYICKQEFSTDDDDKKYRKVRDHCHCKRKYRGAAHSICNLRHKTPKEIPVVFEIVLYMIKNGKRI